MQEIRHLVGGAGVQSDTLRLEITESLVMENPEQASHILDLLKESGVHLALDDFGTGYSSLAYLNRFPFDTNKIDKALVQASSEGDSNAIIVRSIVALAHELGKKIVAEGIETPEDAAFLRSVGCQYAQGFHYGEPMSVGDVGRLLKLIRKADRRMRRRGLVHGAEKKRPETTVAPEMAVAAAAAVTKGAASLPGQPRPSPAVASPAVIRSLSPPMWAPAAVVGDRPQSYETAGGAARIPPAAPVAHNPPPRPLPHEARQAFQPNVPAQAGSAIDRVLRAQSAVRLAAAPQAASPPTQPPNDRVAIAQSAVPVPPGATPLTTAPVAPAMPAPSGGSPPVAPAGVSEPISSTPQRFPSGRRPVRRANLDALPPGIAARLAKLSGKTAQPDAAAAAAAGTLETVPAMPDKSAAE